MADKATPTSPILAELSASPDPIQLDGTAVEQIAALARRSTQPFIYDDRLLIQRTVDDDGCERLRVEDLEDHRASAYAVTGQYRFDDLASLLEYTAPYVARNSTAWVSCSGQAATVRVVFDDHHPDPVLEEHDATLPDPRHGAGKHTATTLLPRSHEWSKWADISGKTMGQADFAAFLEDNSLYVTEPTGASLIELVIAFESTSTAEFKTALRLDNGDRQLVFNETTDSPAGQMSMPPRIVLLLRPFVGMDAVPVVARLKHRAQGGQLRFILELEGVDEITEQATADLRAIVAASVPRAFVGAGRGK